MGVLCQKCGNELKEGAKFCSKCGSKYEPQIEQSSESDMKKHLCKKCGKELIDNEKFCSACGTKYEERLQCRNCGLLVTDSIKFCSNCGTQIDKGESVLNKLEVKGVSKSQDFFKNGHFISYVKVNINRTIKNYKNFSTLTKTKKLLYTIIPIIIIFLVFTPFTSRQTSSDSFGGKSSLFNQTYSLQGLANGEYELSTKENEICRSIIATLSSTPADPRLASTGMYSASRLEALSNVMGNPEVTIEKTSQKNVYTVTFSGAYSISADGENFAEEGELAYNINTKNKTCEFEMGSTIDDLLSVYASKAVSQAVDDGYY